MTGDGYTVDPVVRNVHNYHTSSTSDGTRPAATLRIRCSRGTYIRSLARDLGLALSSGAYLTALRRVSSGEFHLDS
jgi:tRNA pseudouridine55 synthase